MKRLIIMRHGEYDGFSGHLDQEGKSQVAEKIPFLQQQVNGDKVLILTSDKKRAVDTSKIVAAALGQQYKILEVLATDGDYIFNRNKLSDDLKKIQDGYEVVMLVTHYEFAESYPQQFGNDFLNTSFPLKAIPKAAFIVIDCESKTIEYF